MNAVQGKTMENLRNRVKKDYLKWTAKPNFKTQKYLIKCWQQFTNLKLLNT